jgi:putative phosphoribosyl transferase
MSRDPGNVRTGTIASLQDSLVLLANASRFQDRHDAGRRLAALLEPYRDAQAVVVGIPRGGVPVAAEVARSLAAPLDVAIVRKIGAPESPEYAIGALAEGGVHVLSKEAMLSLGLSETKLRALIARTDRDLGEQVQRYRGNHGPVELTGRAAILVDDGLATGSTALAALCSLRKRGATRVIVAVPVAAPASVRALRHYADDVVCVEMPHDLWAVGYWYEDFNPTTDEEVTALLVESYRPAC